MDLTQNDVDIYQPLVVVHMYKPLQPIEVWTPNKWWIFVSFFAPEPKQHRRMFLSLHPNPNKECFFLFLLLEGWTKSSGLKINGLDI